MNSSQFGAIQQAHLAQRGTEQIVSQIVVRRHSMVAALYEYLDRQIVRVSDALVRACRIETGARAVVLGAAVHRHIVERRVASSADADLAANRIEEALTNLRYRRATRPNPSVQDVIGFVASAHCHHLLVALKFVSREASRSRSDEVWVQTAVPVGERTLRRMRAKKEFVAIVGAAEPAVAGGRDPRVRSGSRR